MTVIIPRPPKDYANTDGTSFANSLPTIPEWIPPLDTGQPSAQDLNDLSNIARTNFAARNTPIPLPYGRDRFFGQVTTVTICEGSGCLNVAYSFGEGEINGYEQLFVDGNDVIADGTGYFGIKDRGFESGSLAPHWTGGTVETANPRTGTYHGRVLSAAGGPNLLGDYTVAPSEGTVLRVSGWMARNESALPDANASIAIRFYDSALAAVGGRDTGTVPSGYTNDAASGTAGYQECVTHVTVPAGAAYYRFDFGESAGTTGSWDCDDAFVQVRAEENPTLNNDAMEFVLYTGSAGQVVDGILANILTGYGDTNDGLAYIVGRFPRGSTSGFPRLEAIYQGRKLYDPRKDSSAGQLTENVFTVSRAQEAWYRDHEGIYRTVPANTPQIEGRRKVKNLILDSDATIADTSDNGATDVTGVLPPVGLGITNIIDVTYSTSTAYVYNMGGNPLCQTGRTYTHSAYVKMKDGSVPNMVASTGGGGTMTMQVAGLAGGNLAAHGQYHVSNGWWRIWGSATAVADNGTCGIIQYAGQAAQGGFYVCGYQLEDVTEQESVHPSVDFVLTTGTVAEDFFGTDQFGTPLVGTRTETNWILHSSNYSDAAWSKAGGIILTSGQADPWGGTDAFILDDQNGADYGYISQNITAWPYDNPKTDNPILCSLFVKKDDIDAQTRFVTLRWTYTGGTGFNADMKMDTKTGDHTFNDGNGGGFSEVFDAGDWWRMFFVVWSAQANGNTGGYLRFFPATGDGGLPSAYSPSATGACTVAGAQVEFFIPGGYSGYKLDLTPSAYKQTTTAPVSEVVSVDSMGEPLPFGRGLLMQETRNNEADYSNDWSTTGAYWNTWAGTSVTEVDGVFEGYSGWQHLDSAGGSHSRRQTFGTWTNAQDCVAGVILENVDATYSDIGLYDSTAAAWVNLVRINWSNLSLNQQSGINGDYWIEDLGVGPNGGKMIRLSVSGTGAAAGTGATGNARQFRVYPCGIPTNTDTVIVHHGYFDDVPTLTMPLIAPIVTTGTATVTVAETSITSLGTDWFDPLNGTAVIFQDTSVHEGANNAVLSWDSGGLYEFEANWTAEVTGGGNWQVSGVRPEAMTSFVATWLSNAQDAFAMGVDGVAETNALPGTQPDRVALGNRSGTALESNLWIQEVRYYNKSLPEAYCREISKGRTSARYADDSLVFAMDFGRDLGLVGVGNIGGSGSHRLSDPTTWEYSTNPALCFLDAVSQNTTWKVKMGGVAALADYNDEPIELNVKRREIGLTVLRPDTVEKWIKGFRTYMGGFIGWDNGYMTVQPNRADVEAPGAAQLDGTADTWIDWGDLAVADFSNGDDFTAEFTFKMGGTSGQNQALLGKKGNEAALQIGWLIYVNATDDLVARLSDGTTQIEVSNTTVNLFNNQYHHVALVQDWTADEVTLVVNGVAGTPVSTSTITGNLANGDEFRIGAMGNDTWEANVTVDEVRLWGEVRTVAQLNEFMNKELAYPESEATLLGYWKLNETSGTTAYDSSRNSNYGSLNNGVSWVAGDQQITPDGVVLHLTSDDLVRDTLRVNRRSLRNVPNSVAVDYRDSSGSRWRVEREQSDSARVTSQAEQRRLSRVSLPGIHNATQAKREATERLNWYLTDLETNFSMFDEGWQLQNGSIIQLTHPLGLDGKLLRVTRLTGESGRWTVDAAEYDPAVYSDEVVADPTIPDTNLGDPLNPPVVTNLAAVEELFTKKDGTTGSRIRITFDPTPYSFFSQYLLEGYVGGDKVWQLNTSATEVVTPGIEQLVGTTAVEYDVRVYIQSPFATGDYATTTVNVQGKLAVPLDVSSLVATITGPDSVEFTWAPVQDIDIWRYETRIGDNTDTWETATFNDLMDDTHDDVVGLALGTHRFFVKAVDSVRNYSANAAQVDVTLIAPAPVTTLSGFEIASEVRLSWQRPTTGGSGFAERYRVAYDTIPTGNEITLDVVDTLRFSTKDVPEGTWRFLVYTQDGVGNETATPATIDIEVTSDADAFLADTYTFAQNTTAHPKVVTNGQLTNFVGYTLRLDEREFWVTNMGDSFLSSPSDFNTYSAEPLANYHSSGTATWLSETVDFGLLLTGSWNFTNDIEALNGTVETTLELSADNVSFTSFAGAAKGDFRYARVRVVTTGDSTGFIKSPVMDLKINVVPIEENGEDTGSPTAPKTINLAREYTAVKEVNVQPKYVSGADSSMGVVDNIIVGQNTGVQNNTTAYLNGGDIADLEFGATQSATIEFWMKHSGGSQTGRIILGKRLGTGAGWNVQFNETTGTVTFVVDDGVDEVSLSLTGACPNDGDWHHIVGVIDRTSNVLRGYVDTVVDATTPSISLVGALASSTAPFRIFADNGGTVIWQNGIVDEVRIWDDIRTSGEIGDNWQNELDMTQTQANLLHYWQMNGSIGDTVATSGGGIEDRHATNNDDLDASAASAITFIDPGQNGNNILKINSFDAYIFDIFGQQLNDQFQWNWKGV